MYAHTRRVAAALLALVLATPLSAPAMAGEGAPVTFTLGLGGSLTPGYFGSDRYRLGPSGSFGIDEVRLPGGFGFGSPSTRPLEPGFGLRGAFRLVAARRAADHPELAGLEKVGTALELGLGLGSVAEHWRVFAEVRHGVVGHRGWTGDIGADAILRPSEQVALTLGPRAAFGDARFQRTYFGVTGAESVASGLAAFRPSGGLVSVGSELGLRVTLADGWGLDGALTYDRLRGDAARSPIVLQGSANQYGARLVLTRRFSLGR